MRRKFRLFLPILILFCSFLLCGYEAGEQRVFDEADLLTAEEETRVEAELETAIPEEELDMVILTTADTNGVQTEDYAASFYYDSGREFGWGESDAGILLLIDMDHEEVYVYYSEDAADRFSDEEIDLIIDAFFDSLLDGEYETCCMEFIRAVRNYAGQEMSASENVVPESAGSDEREEVIPEKQREFSFFQRISVGDLLISFGIGAVLAGVIAALLTHRQKSKMTADGKTYARPGAFYMRYSRDYYTHTTTVTRRLHSNRGGRPSGGGGRPPGGGMAGGGRPKGGGMAGRGRPTGGRGMGGRPSGGFGAGGGRRR